MAKLEFSNELDFLKELTNTSFDEICEEALEEAKPSLLKAFKQEMRKVITHEGESDSVNSVKASKAKKSKNGAWIVSVNPSGYTSTQITPSGRKPRKEKVSNSLVTVWLENGIVGKRAPRPFVAKATRSAEKEALGKIQEVYDRKVGVK